MLTKECIRYINKILTTKEGGLAVFSGIASVPAYFQFDSIIQDTEYKKIALIIFIQAIFMLGYSIFNIFDLLTYAISAEIKKEGNFKNKLWNAICKLFAVGMLAFFLGVLAFVCEVMKFEYIYYVFIYILCFLWIMSIGYEFLSIGNNIQKITGKKPKIFALFDTLLSVISRKTINKIGEKIDNI